MAPQIKILLVDDDESIRKVIGFILTEAGHAVTAVDSGAAAIESFRAGRPDLVLTDIKMGEMNGIEVLRKLKGIDPSVPVIVLTAFGTVETAVEAMKLGASDYLTKPISRDELTLTISKVLRLKHLEAENKVLRHSLEQKWHVSNIIGHAPPMREVFSIIERVAPTDVSVLITGESGTGKELVAKAIHYDSPRRGARLVAVNCAAIPSELLESELFGHVRGAFTGAVRDKDGKFQLADGGTLFLDEIGSMPLTLQAKLLRALQEGEVERVGGERTESVDVRVVSATNRALPDLIRGGEFREDLFYRLNVVPITLPPLRKRVSDIPLLVEHFVRTYAGGRTVHFTGEALTAIARYAWPGNVRELANFCERVVLLAGSDEIGLEIAQSHLDSMAQTTSGPAPAHATLAEIEARAVVDALERAAWNKSQAARLLGIPRHVLLYRMKKFDIRRENSN